MNNSRKSKLIRVIGALCILGLILTLVLYALRQNISLFYTPSQIAAGEAPVGQLIRVGGMVVQDSIRRQGLDTQFTISDFKKTLRIHYRGVLPDLFKEGQGVVAQGILQNTHHLTAKQVLAKHDENYMPPEIRNLKSKASHDG